MSFKKTFSCLESFIPDNTLFSLDNNLKAQLPTLIDAIGQIFVDECNELSSQVIKQLKSRPFKNLTPHYTAATFLETNVSIVSATYSLFDVESAEISLCLYLTLFKTKNGRIKHAIYINLSFDGAMEMQAFSNLVNDHRRIFENLMRPIDHFLTCTVSYTDSVILDSFSYDIKRLLKRINTKNISSIDFYNLMLNYDDDTIYILTLKTLVAILDSTKNYYIERKNKDKLIDYYFEINK